MTIKGSCHCGAVSIEIDAELPKELTDCGCSICRRKAGLWAYFSRRQVRVTPENATSIYIWGDRMLENHSCKICACATHWTAVDPSYERMGVNFRMMDREIVAALPIRRISGED